MSLPVFMACLAGYEEHLFDMQLLTVHSGFWAGYYTASKKPKPLHKMLSQLFNAHKKHSDTSQKKQVHVDTVDVEGFLERERRFKARLKAQKEVT